MTSDAYAKPLPYRTSWSGAFWDGVREHRFLIQRCAECDTPRFPPKPVCSNCWSDASREVEASGAGTVYSYTIVHRGGSPAFSADGPYAIVLVDLDEGVRIMSNLVKDEEGYPSVDPEDVKIGMKVRIVFDDVTDDITLPRVTPA